MIKFSIIFRYFDLPEEFYVALLLRPPLDKIGRIQPLFVMVYTYKVQWYR